MIEKELSLIISIQEENSTEHPIQFIKWELSLAKKKWNL